MEGFCLRPFSCLLNTFSSPNTSQTPSCSDKDFRLLFAFYTWLCEVLLFRHSYRYVVTFNLCQIILSFFSSFSLEFWRCMNSLNTLQQMTGLPEKYSLAFPYRSSSAKKR